VVLPELEIYTKTHVPKYVKDKFQTEQMPARLDKKEVTALLPIVTVSHQRASLSSFVESANSFRVGGDNYANNVRAVSPDRKRVVLMTVVKDTNDLQFSVWDVPSKKEIAKWPGAMNYEFILPISLDGKLVVSRWYPPDTSVSYIRVYDLATGKVKTDVKLKRENLSAGPSHSPPTALSCGWMIMFSTGWTPAQAPISLFSRREEKRLRASWRFQRPLRCLLGSSGIRILRSGTQPKARSCSNVPGRARINSRMLGTASGSTRATADFC
jgi:hypothetical protein